MSLLIAAGCGRPPEPARPATFDELGSADGGPAARFAPSVLGVRLGILGDKLAARMQRAGIEYDEVESGLSRPTESLVYHKTLAAPFNERLILVRYVLSEKRVVGIELEYPAGDFPRLRTMLTARWGEGRSRGPVGHAWSGRAANASLMPAAPAPPGGPCTLVINRRYISGYRPDPLDRLDR